MVVGKLPFTARTDGVTGEESEPPHLVFVITGFHRRKEGMERPNTAERGEGEGSQGWAGRASSEDAAPPRPNSAPSSPYLGLVCFLFFLLFLISGLFFFFFCPASHSSVRRVITMKSKLMRHPHLRVKQPVFCFRGALSDVIYV